jgi:hypothetical protein
MPLKHPSSKSSNKLLGQDSKRSNRNAALLTQSSKDSLKNRQGILTMQEVNS